MIGRDRLIRRALRERFVLTLRDGSSFDGLVVDVDEKTYRLANAVAIDGTKRATVDGELFIPRDEVIYLQRPGVTA